MLRSAPEAKRGMEEFTDRACANCGSREPTPFALHYRDRAKARICVSCRRTLEGLPSRSTNRVSDTLPTLAVVIEATDEDCRSDALFTISWEILALMFPRIAIEFITIRDA